METYRAYIDVVIAVGLHHCNYYNSANGGEFNNKIK